jgi:Ca2+-binding RTX toxin-like protein
MFIFGTIKRDYLKGTIDGDAIFGFDGNDTLLGGGDGLIGGARADWLYGGTSKSEYLKGTGEGDVIFGGNLPGLGGDVVIGGAGASRLYVGTMKSDRLEGSSGSDVIYGFDGSDTLLGLGGNDVLIGGAGADDRLYGGDGRDIASYQDSPTGVVVYLERGTGFLGTAAGDRLFDIQGLYGSEFDDLFYGDTADNDLYGGGGDDDLYGRDGNDHLEGGYGNDDLMGGLGADVLDGGEGFDSVCYYQASAPVAASLMRGVGFGGEADGDVYLAIEHLCGSDHGDFLEGDNGYNFLLGKDGNDLLYGWGGGDWIVGGMGRDVLGGGAGPDLFDWQQVEETGTTLATADEVTDFDAAEDRMELYSIDADETVEGRQAFSFIGNAEFSAPGQVRFTIEGDDTVVYLNTRGDLAADAVIVLHGVHALTASDFVLIR